MVTIDSTAERRDGVTLVTATVEGAAAPTRVSVASHLDGPVWPPRRQGEPAAGWTTEGFEGVVPAEGTLSVGFASPAEPADPPLEIVDAEPVAASDDAMDTPAAVVRGLGDPSPPSLVDADDEAGATDDGSDDAAIGTPNENEGEHAADRSLPENGDGDELRRNPVGASSVATGETAPSGFDGSLAGEDDSLPPAVEDWLAAVERRVDCAEDLRASASVEAATRALADCGGVAGVRAVDGDLATDADHLRALERRAAALAERAEGTSVATRALDRLA